MDDPTPGGRRDGLDPGEESRSPDADRYHGAIKDTAHPEFQTTGHRGLPDPRDPLDQPERRQTVDDHASQTAGAGARTQGELARPPASGSERRDSQGDPRDRLPDAEPDAT